MSLRIWRLGYWEMSDRILVTGASGFVGRHLVSTLQAEGVDILQHSFRDGDLARCDLPYENVTHVCHLAARTFVPDSWRSPKEFYDSNLGGTLNVLEFCRRHKAFLILMSSYLYGKPQRLPIDENHPIEAVNPYAHSKLLAEEAARFYAATFHLETAVVRPFNLYGPGQGSQFLIPMLIRQALEPGDTITVADSRPKRDHLHVRDLVRLLVLVLRRRATGVFNAGSGASLSIRQLVDLINRAIPARKSVVSAERLRENEIPETVADCSKAGRELGWWPQISIDDGICEMVVSALADSAGGSV